MPTYLGDTLYQCIGSLGQEIEILEAFNFMFFTKINFEKYFQKL
jgi:hypothetical protein